jgi:D-aspartate ligase
VALVYSVGLMPSRIATPIEPPPGAVVIGGRLPALSAVRSLGRRGVPVAVVPTNAVHIAQYSRYSREHHALLDFQRRPERLLALLETQRDRWRGWALLATDDPALEFLSRHRDELEKTYRVVAPALDAATKLLHKDAFHRIAREVGVDMPISYGRATREAAEAAELRFPVVVKPVESHRFLEHFGVKIFVAHSRAELLEFVESLSSTGLEAEILDLIPGPDTQSFNYTCYLDRSGDVLAEATLHKLRKSPPFFGVVRVAEVAHGPDIPELREMTLAILRHIGWWGMASAEFKLDPRDGRYRIMEINGRCFLMQGLAMAAGVDFPWIAWREVVLGERTRMHVSGWNGVWVNAIDDLYHFFFFRRLEGLSVRQYIESWIRPKAFAILSLSDPMPFLMHCVFGIRKALRMVIDRRYRTAVVGQVQSIADSEEKP